MREPKQSNVASIYIADNLHKLSSCVLFVDNFRECATLNEVYEKIYLLNQSTSIFAAAASEPEANE